MQLLSVILSGIVGTALMTLYMYAISFVTDRVMKVVKILGTMLTMQTTSEGKLSDSKTAITTGIVAHYGVGILFALTYYWLWNHNIGQLNLTTFLLFGLASGLIAIMVWRVFLLIHPRPPAITLKPYLLHLFLAHFIFTGGVFVTYYLLQLIV